MTESDTEIVEEDILSQATFDETYSTIGETENGSVKLNAKRVRLVLEMPYAAVDSGQEIAGVFSPQAKELLAKLRKINTFLCDFHTYKVLECQAEARAEAVREKNLAMLKG